MNWNIYKKSWDIYINGTAVKRVYNEKKAIDLAQKWCGQLFEKRKTEVVDTQTGEIIYQIN